MKGVGDKMAKCKYPGCNKELIGDDKRFCKSCKDKMKDNGKKGAVLMAALLMVFKGGKKAVEVFLKKRA